MNQEYMDQLHRYLEFYNPTNKVYDHKEKSVEQYGKLVITFDNGLVINNEGWTAEDGDEWCEWLSNPDFEFTEPEEFSSIFGLNHDRVVAIEWIADDN